MDDKRVLDLKIQLEALITEREGMIAENQQRVVTGNSPAFVFDDFMKVANAISRVGGG